MFCINFHFLAKRKEREKKKKAHAYFRPLDAFNFRDLELSGDWS